MHRILFVCTGNICRSPTAQGVLRHRLAEQGLQHIQSDSAALYNYHIGEPPDTRSTAMAKRHGIAMHDLRARQVTQDDFNHFTLVLAMDQSHLTGLQRLRPATATAEIALFLPFCGIHHTTEVPDPYYGGEAHFKETYDLIDSGITKLLEKLS